jgi:hypothetical protein
MKRMAFLLALSFAALAQRQSTPASSPVLRTPSGAPCTQEDWRQQFLHGVAPGEQPCRVEGLVPTPAPTPESSSPSSSISDAAGILALAFTAGLFVLIYAAEPVARVFFEVLTILGALAGGCLLVTAALSSQGAVAQAALAALAAAVVIVPYCLLRVVQMRIAYKTQSETIETQTRLLAAMANSMTVPE